MKDLSLKERRKFIRLRAPIGVSYRTVKKGKHQRISRSFLKDISGGGVCFTVKEEFKTGDFIEIELQIPHLTAPVRAIGEVVWCSSGKPKKEEGGEVGLRFCDMDSKDLHRIFEYVYAVGIG